VVPRGAAHPEAAFALLAELGGPRISAELVLGRTWGSGVFRRDHFPLFTEGNAFGLESRWTHALADHLRQTLNPAVMKPVLRLRTPDEREHLGILAEEVRSALARKDADPRQALTAVAQRWRQLDQGKDEKKRLADYRLSLSLPPGK